MPSIGLNVTETDLTLKTLPRTVVLVRDIGLLEKIIRNFNGRGFKAWALLMMNNGKGPEDHR